MKNSGYLIDLLVVMALIAVGFLVAYYFVEPSFEIVNTGVQIGLFLVAFKALDTWHQSFRHQKLWDRMEQKRDKIKNVKELGTKLVGQNGAIVQYRSCLGINTNTPDWPKVKQSFIYCLNNIIDDCGLISAALESLNEGSEYTTYIGDFKRLRYHADVEKYLLETDSKNSLLKQYQTQPHNLFNNQQAFFDLLKKYEDPSYFTAFIDKKFTLIEGDITQLVNSKT